MEYYYRYITMSSSTRLYKGIMLTVAPFVKVFNHFKPYFQPHSGQRYKVPRGGKYYYYLYLLIYLIYSCKSRVWKKNGYSALTLGKRFDTMFVWRSRNLLETMWKSTGSKKATTSLLFAILGKLATSFSPRKLPESVSKWV